MTKEDHLQKACVNWFKYQFPQYKWLLFSIPNGGLRHKRTAVVMKMTGALAGVADLFVSIPNKDFHGLYIELKVGRNKPTESQLTFKKHVESKNYKWICVYNTDDFMYEIFEYLAPHK